MEPVLAILLPRGAEYTPEGERLDICLQKAVAFNHIKHNVFDSNDIPNKPFDFISDISWSDLVKNLLVKEDKVIVRFKAMDYLVKNKVDVMMCDEETTRDILVKYITKEKNINAKASVDKICSAFRMAFKAIGREHSYAEGQILDFMNKPYVNTKNPITSSSVKIINEMISEKTGGESIKPKKYSAVASFAVIYTHILLFFQKALVLKEKGVGKLEMINNAALAMILSLMMHEGGRPGEFFRKIRHQDLYFATQEFEMVYFLTLVFLSPQCLNELMEKHVFKKFTYDIYKGKDKQEYRGRHKSVIPCFYNMLDLCFLYVLYMKIIFDPTDFDPMYVFDTTKNYSHYLATRVVNTVKFTFYAIRYACCEEDKKYGIEPKWSKYTLGHSAKSVQKDKYANNKDERVKCGADVCPLGVDMLPNKNMHDDAADIPLEFKPLEGCIVPPKLNLDVLSPESREEFIKVVQLTQLFVEENCEESYKTLCELYNPDLSSIKIGIDNFTIPNGALPSNLHNIYRSSVDYFKRHFSSFTLPSSFIKPWIWSYVQTRFGDFSKLIKGASEKMLDPVVEPKSKEAPQPAEDGAIVVDVDKEGELRLIDKIIKHRRKNNKVEYLVKWTNLPDSENEWIKKSNITPEARKEYHAENPTPRKRARKS